MMAVCQQLENTLAQKVVSCMARHRMKRKEPDDDWIMIICKIEFVLYAESKPSGG